MPSPKDGTAPAAVSPVEPGQAEEADNADPGLVGELKQQQQESETGKYGSKEAEPHKKDPTKTAWIEIELVDEEDQPVPGERYEITLPDGKKVARGSLDNKGFARIDGIDSGTCKVSFPRLDQDAWTMA